MFFSFGMVSVNKEGLFAEHGRLATIAAAVNSFHWNCTFWIPCTDGKFSLDVWYFFPEVLQGKDRTCAFVNVLNNSLLVFFYSNWFFVPKQVSLSKKNSTCKPKPINITFQTQAYRFQFHAIREKALTTLREKTKISSADNKFLLYFSLQLKAG